MPSYLFKEDREFKPGSFTDLPFETKGEPRPVDSIGWSHCARITVKDSQGQEREMVLKQLKDKTREDTEDVLRTNQKFYEWLKSIPGLKKFLPPTEHFLVPGKSGNEPKAYHSQPFIEGKALDQIIDKELYSDPEVVRQLLELVNILEEVLAKAKKEKSPRPDLLRALRRAKIKAVLSGFLSHPRYTSNIMIADTPDQNKQRVFFVDTAQNGDERAGEFYGKFQIFISNLTQGHFLQSWKKKLEEVLARRSERV